MKKLLFIMLVLFISTAAHAASETVYVYNWAEYIPDEVIHQFQKDTGIKVKYSTYDNNESMYAKLKLTKSSGYDVVFPSTYFIDKMRKEGMLAQIDISKLKNANHLDDRLLDKPYDPGNKYSIPYVWGSTGIGYNSTYVKKETVTKWTDLWKPVFKNRLVVNDDIREVFGLGLIINGFSINDTNPDHIKKAYESLKQLMPNIRVFNADSPKQPFLNHETYAGMTWNGEMYMAAEEDPNMGYIYPMEGAIFWVDSMAIPANAKNKENAHKFIDYILKPHVAKQICEYVGFAPANKSVRNLLADNLKNNKMIFPDKSDIDNGEFQLDVGEAILVYEKYWERLKTEM